ncbi:MAG TPA: hypothetical protein VIJ99_04270 [Acidimicrobiales bacterium]
MNDYGRSVVKSAFENVLAAERDPNHEWHVALTGPIDPSLDQDNPLSMLARQNETSTNAELASLTIDEQFLNDGEAWAWLTTLQVALRSTAQSNGLLTDEQLAATNDEILTYVRMLQQFLFDLAACF